MRRRVCTSLLLVVGAAATCFGARTATQIKAEFAKILPAGKKARMVWLMGGTQAGFDFKDNQLLSVYGVDSDDGIVRKIKDCGGTQGWRHPMLTADGSRILYCDFGGPTIYVMNWDGTNTVKVADYNLQAYWYDAANKTDYAICNESYGTGPVRRINVDTKAAQVLYDKNPLADGSPRMGISADCKTLGAWFGDRPGTVSLLPAGTPVTSANSGCGMDVAPDNTGDYFIHNGPNGGHTGIRICHGSTNKQDVNTTSSIVSTLGLSNNEYDDAKWSNDRNFITFSMWYARQNPFIYNIANGTWMYVDDFGPVTTWGADVKFLPAGGVSVVNHTVAARTAAAAVPAERYSLAGRRIAGSAGALRFSGVMIVGDRGVTGALLRVAPSPKALP